MHPEEEGRPEVFEYTDQLYRKYISPDSKIVSVGPSSSINADPTLLLALRLAINGEVHVADPRFSHQYPERLRPEAGPSQSGGIGGINSYREHIKLLNEIGIDVPDFEWLGSKSGVYNIPITGKDLIIDHATSLFVSTTLIRDRLDNANTEEAIQIQNSELKKFFEQYNQALKKGGKAIIQTSKEGYRSTPDAKPRGRVLTDIRLPLQETGFEVRNAQLTHDIANIELSEKESSELKRLLYALETRDFENLPDDSLTRQFLKELSRLIRESNNRLILTITAACPSKEVYIATKK